MSQHLGLSNTATPRVAPNRPVAGTPATGERSAVPGEKGLKRGALGLVSSVVIGVASTAPAYSLASSLGIVVVAVGLQTPAVMWISFVPMLLIATAYYQLNKADPDCGTIFSWATRAFGPRTGWIGGWAVLLANVIVMANLAQIAGSYSYRLIGLAHTADNRTWVTAAGVTWILVMTGICYVGIEVSARTQWCLLAAEIAILSAFSIVALSKVYREHPVGAIRPSWRWLDPLAVSSSSALTAGVLTTIFIYWGWDATVTVNEETTDSARTPGIGALLSTLILLGVYVGVAVASQAYHGTHFLAANQSDVLGALGKAVLSSPWNKLLILAVLTSASASTQTTILPAARTVLSMSAHGAAPRYFGRIQARHRTPSTSTLWMGALSVVWYVALAATSKDILADSVEALGLMISFYYSLTGFACIWYYRRRLLTSPRSFLLIGAAPLAGAAALAYVFARSAINLANPVNSGGRSLLGVGSPVVIALGGLLLGLVLMQLQRRSAPAFFERRSETAS